MLGLNRLHVTFWPFLKHRRQMTKASAYFTRHYRTKKESPFHSVLNGTAPHQNFHPLGKFVPVKTLFDALKFSFWSWTINEWDSFIFLSLLI